MTDYAVLDMCCGPRMFWFDKQAERAVFSDIRAEDHTFCDGRYLVISPNVIADFRAQPFGDTLFLWWCLTRHILNALVTVPGWERNTGS